MARRYVKELSDKESIDEVFLASDKQLRSNRQGNLYLQCELSDKTGSINARMWNATEDIARRFENGDYVRVHGTTQIYQGALQLIATKIAKAASDDVADEDFQQITGQDIQQLRGRLAELLSSISDPALSALAQSYLDDETWMDKFSGAPAGVKNHHAYHGGLLQHVVQLMEIVSRIGDLYPNLDPDLMLIGTFLHDSGKVDELTYERNLQYSDQGQLLGHIVLALSVLDTKIAELEKRGVKLPDETALRLRHMIVSHHGSLEFGSPTVPMTLEAVALHHLDNLDAKIHHFTTLLRDDANVDSHWTQYHPNIGRKLFKGASATPTSSNS